MRLDLKSSYVLVEAKKSPVLEDEVQVTLNKVDFFFARADLARFAEFILKAARKL